MPDDHSIEDAWTDTWTNAVYEMSQSLKETHQTNPWPNLPILPQAMIYLATELWDRGFSQTEIRQAFKEALKELPNYAAGDEVRN